MSASKEQWERYIRDYENNMPEPTPDNIADYAKQWAYLQWLKATYNQYENDWENMPATISMTTKAASGIYKSRLDNQLHAVIIAPFSGSSAIMAQSDEFNVTVAMELYNSSGRMPQLTSEYYEDNTYVGVQSFISNSGYSVKQSITGAPYFTDSTYNNGNTGSQFYTCHIRIYKGGTPSVLPQNAFGSAYDFMAMGSPASFGAQGLLTTLTGDIDTADPWDFYNDEILPSIDPDDAAFPNGWEPPGPGNDPDDGPEEDQAPDKTDWGDPMNPSNGFEIPYGFANYKAFNNDGIINFAERLWDAPDSFWEALTIANKNNANWLDYFISLRAYPYWINSTGEEANIYVGAGGQFYLGDEGTNLYASNPQHITFFVLNFSIDKYYNNFLDFAPYTKAYVYLPFSGTWEVNPKYLYHTSLQILLKLDITDGSGVWQVIRSGADSAGSGYIILEKQCKIGVEIPLSGLNATTMSSNIVNATLGTFQRTGNEIGKIAGTITSGAALGGPVGATLGMAAGAVMTGLENSVDMANANREHISVNGGMSGLAAANCNVIPSITLVRPIAQNPDSFPHTIGHLVNKAATLSSLNGFTTCRNVDVSNVGQATDKEKAQLKKILENGFYAVSG